MRAVVAHAAKDLRIEEVATPDVGPNEVRVRIGFGGICGSDLHYFNHGGFGAVRLREPMILGHEVAGIVEAVGAEVTRVKPGDRVAVSPSLPCNACRYCLEGPQNQCLDMRFYGSAMRMPHVQGAFREALVCAEEQVYRDSRWNVARNGGDGGAARRLRPCRAASGRSRGTARAGDRLRPDRRARRPRGAARRGARDRRHRPHGRRRSHSREGSAPTARSTVLQAGRAASYTQGKGYFDAAFEASGATSALRNCIETVRPGGVIVQLGLGGGT